MTNHQIEKDAAFNKAFLGGFTIGLVTGALFIVTMIAISYRSFQL